MRLRLRALRRRRGCRKPHGLFPLRRCSSCRRRSWWRRQASRSSILCPRRRSERSEARRIRPPGDIPTPQPMDLQADAAGTPRSERTNVAEDVLSAAKSVFNSVIPAPVRGGKGNIQARRVIFFACFLRRATASLSSPPPLATAASDAPGRCDSAGKCRDRQAQAGSSRRGSWARWSQIVSAVSRNSPSPRSFSAGCVTETATSRRMPRCLTRVKQADAQAAGGGTFRMPRPFVLLL